MFDPDSDSSFSHNQSSGPRNYAKFYLEPILNKFKSKEAGRDIYESKEFILIICPGQNKTEVRRPVQENDKKEYHQEWRAFVENKPDAIVGTPIENLPRLDPGMARQLKHLNIHTIEQMASLSDSGLANIGIGANELKTRAKAFIEKNSDEVVALRERVADLEKKLEQLSKPKKQPKEKD